MSWRCPRENVLAELTLEGAGHCSSTACLVFLVIHDVLDPLITGFATDHLACDCGKSAARNPVEERRPPAPCHGEPTKPDPPIAAGEHGVRGWLSVIAGVLFSAT